MTTKRARPAAGNRKPKKQKTPNGDAAAGEKATGYDPATDGDFWDWRERVDGPAKRRYDRPEIPRNGNLAEQEEALRAVFAARQEVFRYGRKVVRVSAGPKADLTEYTPAMLTTYASKVAFFWRMAGTQDAKTKVEAEPSNTVIRAVLDDPHGLKGLRQIARHPIFKPDGSLVSTSGYHEDIETYVAIPPTLTAALDGFDPTAVTQDDAKQAHKWLYEELLVDFCWKDKEASRTNALAALIHPFVRPMYDGPSPTHVIDANRSRCGKGLLTKVIALPSMGSEPDPHPEPESRAEWKKAILSYLLAGESHVWIDNINNAVKSGALASVLTAWPNYSDRLLGKSETAVVPNQCCWILNGNNVKSSTENAKRQIASRLHWDDDPERRKDFRHRNLLRWMRENRGEIVRNILTLIAHWVNEGMRPGPLILGGFEGWAETTSGIFESIDVTSLMGNRDEWLGAADDEADEWLQFYELWEAELKMKNGVSEAMTATDLLAMVQRSNLGLFAVTDRTSGRSFGHTLSAEVGSVRHGRRLVKSKDGERRYSVERVRPGRPAKRRRRS